MSIHSLEKLIRREGEKEALRAKLESAAKNLIESPKVTSNNAELGSLYWDNGRPSYNLPRAIVNGREMSVAYQKNVVEVEDFHILLLVDSKILIHLVSYSGFDSDNTYAFYDSKDNHVSETPQLLEAMTDTLTAYHYQLQAAAGINFIEAAVISS